MNGLKCVIVAECLDFLWEKAESLSKKLIKCQNEQIANSKCTTDIRNRFTRKDHMFRLIAIWNFVVGV